MFLRTPRDSIFQHVSARADSAFGSSRAGHVAVGVAEGVILGCVIIETYCALQTQQGYDRCVQAANQMCSKFGSVGRK
jgi:hypothetical protein